MQSLFQGTLDHLKSVLQKSTKIDFTTLPQGNISFYAKENLGRTRDTMPQIDDFDEVIMHFSNSVNGEKRGVKKVRRKVSDLKPAQNEINLEKVQKMNEDGYDWKSRKYLISKDEFILDGHHAYALGLQLEPDYEVDCYKINLPATEALRRLNLMKASSKRDLDDNNITKAFMILLDM